MMKIAFINEYFLPFTPGGAEWSTYYLAKELVKNGHQVMVITPNYGAKPFEVIDGIAVFRFPFPFKLKKGQDSAPYYAHNNFFFYLYSGFWIWKYLRAEKPDIINAQNRYSLIGSFLAAKLLKVPVVFTIRDNNSFCPTGMCTHHFDEKNPPQKCGFISFWQKCSEEYLQLYFPQKKSFLKLWRKLILFYFWLDTKVHQYFMNKTDGIVAISQVILNIYQKAQVIQNVKTSVIYSVPPPRIVISSREKQALRQKLGLQAKRIILAAGKVSVGKGSPQLLSAARKIIPDYPDIVFLFVGKKTMVISKNLKRQIKFITFLPHETLQKIYHLAEMIVIPSRMPDALSRVLLEAMAAGKPLIGTITGGTPEIISHNVNGLLVSKEDVKSLAKAIRQILGNKTLAKKLAKGNQMLLSHRFNEDLIINKLLAFYRQYL